MRVICFCDADFIVDGDLGKCPNCKRAVCWPHLTDEDERQMQAELDLVLSEHAHADDSTN